MKDEQDPVKSQNAGINLEEYPNETRQYKKALNRHLFMTNWSTPFFYFLLGVALITLLDTVGSILSNRLGFKYSLLFLFSLAIYLFIGLLIGKTNNYAAAFICSGLLGLFDSTVGLKLSFIFKANSGLDENQRAHLPNKRVSFYMMVVSIVLGSMGFAIARFYLGK